MTVLLLEFITFFDMVRIDRFMDRWDNAISRWFTMACWALGMYLMHGHLHVLADETKIELGIANHLP
jgi:hypothetical protein